MDVFSECETLRTEFNKLADKHNLLLTENLKLQSQLEYKDTIMEFLQSIQRPVEQTPGTAKSVRPQMSFTLVKRVSKTHAK